MSIPSRLLLRRTIASIRPAPTPYTHIRISNRPIPTQSPISVLSRTMSSQTRQPSTEEQTIIDEVLTLYQCNPTEKSYSHYAPKAVFHDPVSIAEGLESVKSQFNGMPKIFESSTTKKCDVLSDNTHPNNIILDLTQHYVFKGSVMPEKTMNSKITLKRNGDGLIEHHEEEWDHEPNKTGEDGFMGKLQELRKKAGAKLIEVGVSSDPKKV